MHSNAVWNIGCIYIRSTGNWQRFWSLHVLLGSFLHFDLELGTWTIRVFGGFLKAHNRRISQSWPKREHTMTSHAPQKKITCLSNCGNDPKMIWNNWDGEFQNRILGGGFKYFLFSPRSLGKVPISTHIFQRGWNHQLGYISRCWEYFCNTCKICHEFKSLADTFSVLFFPKPSNPSSWQSFCQHCRTRPETDGLPLKIGRTH